jgi:hypothetical protein
VKRGLAAFDCDDHATFVAMCRSASGLVRITLR